MKRTTRTGVIGAAAVALTVGITVGAAPAGAGPLPGGSVKANLGAGTTMQAVLAEEKVSYQRSGVAAVPTSREVWVSGKVRVSVSGAATGGIVKGGYVIGCQVDLSSLSNSGNATVNSEGTVVAGPTVGSTLTVGAGQAVYVPIINQTNYELDGDNELYRINGYQFSGSRASVVYSQEPLRVNGCAGYAQARARMTIQVSTPSTKSETTLWGRPFSLG